MSHRKTTSQTNYIVSIYNKFVYTHLEKSNDIICNLHYITSDFNAFNNPFNENYQGICTIFFKNKDDFNALEIEEHQYLEKSKFFVDENNILDVLFIMKQKKKSLSFLGYKSKYFLRLQNFFSQSQDQSYNKKSLLLALLNNNIISLEQSEKYKDIDLSDLSCVVGFVGILVQFYNDDEMELDTTDSPIIKNKISISNFSRYSSSSMSQLPIYYSSPFSIYEYNIENFYYFFHRFDKLKHSFDIEIAAPKINNFNNDYFQFFDNFFSSNSKHHEDFFNNVLFNDIGKNFLSSLAVYSPILFNKFLEKNILNKNLTGSRLQKQLYFLNQITSKTDISQFKDLLAKYPILNKTPHSLSDFMFEEAEFTHKITLNISEIFLKILPQEEPTNQFIFTKFLYNCVQYFLTENYPNVNLHTDVSINSIKNLDSLKSFNYYFSSNNEDNLDTSGFRKFFLKVFQHPELDSFYKDVDLLEVFSRSVVLELKLEKDDKQHTNRRRSKI